MLYLKQLGVTWVSLAAYAGDRHRRRLHQDAGAMGGRRLQGLQHRQRRGAERQPAQHAGGHAQSARPRPEDRRVPELHPLPGQSRHSLHHLRPHGQRHLAQRPRDSCRAATPAPICDLSSPEPAGNWGGKTYSEPLSHGRVFTKEEIWDNYTYFIKKVVPVAEEAGVRIGIHPDDPPQPMLAGVPRCIFSNFEGYKSALEIANSPNIGVCLCCGTWLEGGKMTGKDPVEMISYFGGEEDLQDPLPQRQRAAAAFHRDPDRRRLLRHEQNHEGAGGRQVRRDHDSRSRSGLGQRPESGRRKRRGGGAGRGPGTFRANPALAYLLGCMNSMLLAAQGKA